MFEQIDQANRLYNLPQQLDQLQQKVDRMEILLWCIAGAIALRVLMAIATALGAGKD